TLPAPAWTVLPAADRRRAVLAEGRPRRRGGGLVHRAAAVAAAVRHAPPRRPRGAARLLRSGREPAVLPRRHPGRRAGDRAGDVADPRGPVRRLAAGQTVPGGPGGPGGPRAPVVRRPPARAG